MKSFGTGVFIFVAFLLPQLASAGTQSYTTPGTYSFTVPAFGYLALNLYGSGGGGGGGNGNCQGEPPISGGTGATTSFGNMVYAYGGGGGAGAVCATSPHTGAMGSGGTATGGYPNTTGGGNGGSGGGVNGSNGYTGGTGGSGGKAIRTFTQTELPIGTVVTIVIGSGGTGGHTYPSTQYPWYESGDGTQGLSGSAYLSWTNPPAPTCTITLTPTTIAYGSSSTLSWSSTNANTSMYINNVGYVAVSGSTTVSPSTSTNYTGTATGSGGTATCNAAGTSPAGTLTVTPPATPATAITASSTSIYVGQSTGIRATFAAGSGDTLTHDNIDSPVGTGLGATQNPDATKYYTFTPSTAGTYTFYARAQTSYFTSWTTYNSVNVTVTAPPSCTPAYTCSTNTIQYTNASCAVSNITTCVSPAFCSAGSSSCLYAPPSYNQSGSLSGHLQATPLVVPQSATTKLFWNVSNVSSCSVSGTDGENWSGTTSGSSGKTTTPILQQTTFTLTCAGLDSSSVHETLTINVVPVFQER